MADHRFLDKNGDTLKTFATEDGKHYRHYRQDVAPIIERVKTIGDAQSRARRKNFEYVGSIPMTMLVDWLQKQGKGLDDFYSDNDLKAKFMAWFKSRDNSKLHTQNVTSKRSDSGFHFMGGD